jgi:hypothetical protein
MLLSFNKTVTAMSESIVRELDSEIGCKTIVSCESDEPFVLKQCARMPDFLRLPFRCLVLFFDAWAIVFTGRPFHKLAHDRRWRQIQAWKESKIGFRKDLVRFVEGFTVFSRYCTIAREDSVSC